MWSSWPRAGADKVESTVTPFGGSRTTDRCNDMLLAVVTGEEVPLKEQCLGKIDQRE